MIVPPREQRTQTRLFGAPRRRPEALEDHSCPCVREAPSRTSAGEPHLDKETRVLAELHAEGVVKNVFRLADRPGVYLTVEANDVEDARKQLGACPSSEMSCSSSKSSQWTSWSEAERGVRDGHSGPGAM